MRWFGVGFSIMMMLILSMERGGAEEKRRAEDQILGGVISGLLGQPQGSPDATYTAQERDRLVSLLQSGDYVTSRQGESVDMMVYGVPLTHKDHVYTAKPIQPATYTTK